MAFGLLRRTFAWAKRGDSSQDQVVDDREATFRSELLLIDQLFDENRLDEARFRLEALHASIPSDPDVLTRLGHVAYLQGDYSSARHVLGIAVSADPHNVRAQKYLAASSIQLNDLAGAIAAGMQAAQLDTQDAELENVLGAAYTRLGHFEVAAEHFHRALEIDSDNPIPLMNLQLVQGRVARKFIEERPATESARRNVLSKLMDAFRRDSLDIQGLEVLLSLTASSRERFSDALAVANVYATAQSLSPNAALHMASIFGHAGDHQRAVRLRETAYRIDPALPEARMAMANSLIHEGGTRWAEGWRLWDETLRKLAPLNYATEVPEWNGEDLGGQRLLVYQELGFGDTVLGLRLIPLLAKRGVRVVLWVKSALAGLARSVPGYEELLGSENRPDARAHGCTYCAPLLGLVRLLHLEPAALKNPPLLRAPEEASRVWRERLTSLAGKRIGLASAGNSGRADDWLRTIPAEALEPLFDLRGISWVNLSVDRRPETESAITLLKMADPTLEIRNFGDTAAIIDALDAVIAIDCSVAHVAASMGKPVWVLLPTFRDWRWQLADDTQAWWPKVTMLRAEAPGLWTQAIAQLGRDLENGLIADARG